MCRFVLYKGPSIPIADVVTRPEHSLIHQSYHCEERSEPLNGDGFGVSWYADGIERPAQFRSIAPAWNNRNLREIARVTSSPLIMAHVRAASKGLPISEANCHPFKHSKYSFMHNGVILGFQALRRKMIGTLSDRAFRTIEGSSDSEHLFAMTLDRLITTEKKKMDPLEKLAQAMKGAISTLMELFPENMDEIVEESKRFYDLETPGPEQEAEHTLLNLALSDGKHAVICRFTTGNPDEAISLYARAGKQYVCNGREIKFVDCEPEQKSCVVTSEPLTHLSEWRPVPPQHMLLISEDNSVELRSIF